jgi:hypothetical protein
VKRRPHKDSTREESELPTEPDLSDFNELVGRDIEHFYELCASGRLTEILDNIAGLVDATDPDATALLNAVNPP